MTLDGWLKADGAGSVERLHRKAGVSLPVIGRARKGKASLASAAKIHLATGGAVPVASMTSDDVPPALATKAATRRAAERAPR